ncbi:MAG: C39 family peptidase [bacterium]
MRKCLNALIVAVSFCGSLNAAPIVIEGVPAYLWYKGCAPTSAAMLVSYWQPERQGQPLISELAQRMLATPSGGVQWYRIDDVLRTYDLAVTPIIWWQGDTFVTTYRGEIDAGHPVLLSVDVTADGNEDHVILGVGYDDARYLAFNTYSMTAQWYDLKRVQSGVSYGVSRAMFVEPIPEPSVWALFGTGLLLLGLRGKR